MVEQTTITGGFPWSMLLQNASPWTFAVFLGYLLWDTLKRQAQSAQLLRNLAQVLQTSLGEIQHELNEIRRTQSQVTHHFAEVDASVAHLGEKTSTAIREAILALTLRAHDPRSNLPRKE